MDENTTAKMDRLMWHAALNQLTAGLYQEWRGDEPGMFLARTVDDRGVIQFDAWSTAFGKWDGERGTDGALLTLENGDVYNECGGLVSRGR